MKFETTSAFDSDFRRLKREHAAAFRAVIARTSGYRWPASLRVSRLTGTGGIWEMTWSFASPDGRATFEFVQRQGELVCRWRRVGDHSGR